ncbi:MAG: DUF3375 domain-containing protein [Limnochordia bacterium]|jgi:hypothetical protein
MDYDHLVNLRANHPAWRLLAADSAPFVISFLHWVFIEPNERAISEQELISRLDDYLFHLRERRGEGAYRRPASEYLNEWTSESRGWLRRYYPMDSDEPHFDLTPAAEQAIQWVVGLGQRQFVGAESRLKLIFDLLNEIVQGTESDPEARLAALMAKRAEIDTEIARISEGKLSFLEPTQLRERFLQVVQMAYALLSDFRQVEQNFRDLDRQVRERIATWDGSKREVLEDVFAEHDLIADTDQGRSFQAFWDFLMSPERQEELSHLLNMVIGLEEVADLRPDAGLRTIHYDWLTAGEQAQRTVARLSEQLRRFLDEQALLENKRIMTLLRGIEEHALALRGSELTDLLMDVDDLSPTIELRMDRPLYEPPFKPSVESESVYEGEADVSVDLLFDQVHVDKERLRSRLRRELMSRPRIGLDELLQRYPLEQGLTELVAWLSLASEGKSVTDETRFITVEWVDGEGRLRKARLHSVVFLRDDDRYPGTR